jgi:hypothetical protein
MKTAILILKQYGPGPILTVPIPHDDIDETADGAMSQNEVDELLIVALKAIGEHMKEAGGSVKYLRNGEITDVNL